MVIKNDNSLHLYNRHKKGVGSPSLKELNNVINIDEYFGLSISSIDNLKNRIDRIIKQYENESEIKLTNNTEELNAILAGDETFFNDLMLMVMIDLPSGFILLEESAENRTYETWQTKAKSLLKRFNIKVKGFVSDRYSGLIKLATKHFGVFHTPDSFHMSNEIVKTFGSYFQRSLSKIRKEMEARYFDISLAVDMQSFTNGLLKEQLDEKLMLLENEYIQLLSEQDIYKEELHRLSLFVHPFNVETNARQSTADVISILKQGEKNLKELASYHKLKTDKIDKYARQIDDISQLIDSWWKWIDEYLSLEQLNSDMFEWLVACVLPTVYWKNQINKTDSKPIQNKYKEAFNDAQNKYKKHFRTKLLDSDVIENWHNWAEWIVSQFQRSSSPVEGRNGFLSFVHHGGRGLSKERLQTLKIIHNYDTRGPDGRTPAERLFNREFPDLLEYILENIGDLPLPRASKKSKKKNKDNTSKRE